MVKFSDEKGSRTPADPISLTTIPNTIKDSLVSEGVIILKERDANEIKEQLVRKQEDAMTLILTRL